MQKLQKLQLHPKVIPKVTSSLRQQKLQIATTLGDQFTEATKTTSTSQGDTRVDMSKALKLAYTLH